MDARVWILLTTIPAAVFLVPLACGSFQGSDAPGGGDAAIGNDAGSAADGASATFEAGGPCDPDTAFGPVAPLFDNESILPYLPSAPQATQDELTLYFFGSATSTNVNLDVYVASRASTTEAWGNVHPLTSVNGPKADGFPSVNASDTVLAMQSGRYDGGQAVWLASRSGSDDFVVADMPLASTPMHTDGQPFLDVATGGIYFVSDGRSDGGRGFDIFFATLQNGKLGNISPVAVNSRDVDQYPAATANGLQLYFVSDKDAGPGAATGDHVYVASRASPEVGFDKGAIATDLDGQLVPTWFSPDGCRAYGTRKNGGSNVSQLVFSSRPR